jgi:hypothetical protein
MFCKLQHGKLEGIQYLQSSKAWQVIAIHTKHQNANTKLKNTV